MGGLYSPDPLPDSITLQQMGTQALAPSVGEVQGAVAGAALAGLPTPRLLQQGILAAAETGTSGVSSELPFAPPDLEPPPIRVLQPDELNQKYAVEGHLKFDAPMSEARAQLLHDQKLDAAKRADILNRNEGTQWGTGLVARFLPSLAISALDPLNVAAAFVPVIGEARYAELLAAQGTSAFARAGVRAGIGAAQGAVGTAALQPLEFALSRAEQNDYTMTDALASIAMGSVLGGGLHTLGGYIGDVREARLVNPLAQRLEDAGPEARDTLLRGAVAQTAEEKPVNVAAALDANELAAREAAAARAARQAEITPEVPRPDLLSEAPAAPSEAAVTAVPAEDVPSMITQAMRRDLVDRGFSEEQIREMTPQQVYEALAPIPEVAQARAPTPDVSRETIPAAAGPPRQAETAAPAAPVEGMPSQVPEAPAPIAPVEGVPFMITQGMRRDLRDRGFGEEQIRNMTPQQARDALAPTPEVAQARAPTPDVSQQTIDAAAFRQEIAAAGGQMNIASDQLAGRVGQALDEGRPVTLFTSDGKPVPIVAVTRGMMQDAAGGRWGTLDLATDRTGRARVEIGSPGDVLREAPARTPAEIRQQLLDIQRADPAPHDTAVEAEAQRITEKVPETVDEAAANKMLADAQKEVEALRQPPAEGAEQGELPPEVQQRLDESEAASAREEDHARALEEVGACLSEQGIQA